jgi:DNA-binding LytR/AlgR family response regulator
MNNVEPQLSGRRTGTSGTQGSQRDPDQRQVAEAWERFAAGDDAVQGVRPSILLSWYRCRDVHKVSPHLRAAPEADVDTDHSLQQDVLFTKLGGAAGAAASQVSLHNTLITVTDGAGRILASWGPQGCLRHGTETSLAPTFSWSEPASGTNGMGTALERPGLALVEGAEHWCQGFHEWNCAGIAIRDPVSQAPLAALNVSRWGEQLPDAAAPWLRRTAQGFESELRDQAIHNGKALLQACAELDAKVSGVLVAVDVAGKVIIANETARALLGVVCSIPAIDPNARLTTEVPDLALFVRQAVRRAVKDADWRGIVQLEVPSEDEVLTAELRPVRRAHEVVGILVVGSDHPTGEQLGRDLELRKEKGFPPRIGAIRGTRIVLLSPQEIRYAEADSHAVWLMTDRGRLRAAARGIDNIERQLSPSVFLRVHRRYIVNVGRVKEVEQGFKGALTLTTSSCEHEGIPVSRRHSAQLRRALGF